MRGRKARVEQPPPHGLGAPWTLLYFVSLVLLMIAVFGLDRAAAVAAIAMNVVFFVYLLRHLAFAAASARFAERDIREASHLELGFTPRVSVLVACRNEALVAESLVASMVALDYPGNRLEVLLIDDGSDDGSGEMLDGLVASHRHIRVLHRPAGRGGGKSGALNEGLGECSGEIFVIFDADHNPQPDVLRRLVRHFQDPKVDAVQGRCVVRNWRESVLSRAVAIDYLSGYLVNEYGRQALFQLPAYGGANCAVRRATLERVGGWNHDSVTEDTDLTLRIVLAGGRVRYDVTAVDTEQAPTTLGRFCRQRYRWARGHQQAWRDYHRAIYRTPHLSLLERIETYLFLLVFHVPVVCFATVVLLALRLAGIGHPITLYELLPLTALLFAGPFCELAVGLLTGRAPRWAAWSLMWMLPIFWVSMAVCTKAWLDGILGRPYAWVKTQRSAADVQVEPLEDKRVAA